MNEKKNKLFSILQSDLLLLIGAIPKNMEAVISLMKNITSGKKNLALYAHSDKKSPAVAQSNVWLDIINQNQKVKAKSLLKTLSADESLLGLGSSPSELNNPLNSIPKQEKDAQRNPEVYTNTGLGINENNAASPLRLWQTDYLPQGQLTGISDILSLSIEAQKNGVDIPGTSLWSVSQGLESLGPTDGSTGAQAINMELGGINVNVSASSGSPQDIASEVQMALSECWRELALSVSQGVNQ